MNFARKARSAEALDAALQVMGPCHPHTAAFLIFMAAAKNLAANFGDRRAGELIYGIADELVTREPR